jgi:hypothetical protein
MKRQGGGNRGGPIAGALVLTLLERALKEHRERAEHPRKEIRPRSIIRVGRWGDGEEFMFDMITLSC